MKISHYYYYNIIIIKTSLRADKVDKKTRKSRISAVEDKSKPTILHTIFDFNQVKK